LKEKQHIKISDKQETQRADEFTSSVRKHQGSQPCPYFGPENHTQQQQQEHIQEGAGGGAGGRSVEGPDWVFAQSFSCLCRKKRKKMP
jgi:hypothetical protein